MTKHHAEGGSGFALAFASVNNQQSALNGFAGHDFIARGFFLGHFLVVASGIFFQFFGHFCNPFKTS